MTFTIFLSHNGRDTTSAIALARYLRQIPDTEVFLSEENLIAGNLADGLIAQIKKSDVFVVLHSTNSQASQYVQNEIGVARGNDKIMLILSLDPTKPTAMLEGITYYSLYDAKNLPLVLDYLRQKAKEKSDNKALIEALALLGTFLGGLALGYWLSKHK